MIYGQRLRLRATTRADLPLFVRWFNDPEVTQHLPRVWPLSPEAEETWFTEMLTRPEYERPLVIEVRQDTQWLPIGNCAFHRIDWRNRSAEVGIVIGEKNFWGQGYGREALGLLVEAGFERLNLHRIWLHVHTDHIRAIKAYQGLGFVEEGRLRQAHFRQGRYVDVVVMSVLRPEWVRARSKSEHPRHEEAGSRHGGAA
ncbi:MAG TPA: N-acetyltransferase [Anaerolineaceae bacterium]|nr:N-acetyltransferase [Anaerolineales bacterium]HIQ08616.1 N-acetyltransferase [Anaerolineaceae bacterium]